MSEPDHVHKTKELFGLLGEAFDARNQHILENGPENTDYYPRLKELELEMWAAHSRWQNSLLSR